MEKNELNLVKFNEFAERMHDAAKRIVEIALEFETPEGYRHNSGRIPDYVLEEAKRMLTCYEDAQRELAKTENNGAAPDDPAPDVLKLMGLSRGEAKE